MKNYSILVLLCVPALLFGMAYKEDAQVQFLKQISKALSSSDNSLQAHFRKTIVHYATACGKLSELELLLKNNEYIGAKDNHGRTPLHYAVLCRATERESIQFLWSLLSHSFFEPESYRAARKTEEEKEGVASKIRSIISGIFEKIKEKKSEVDEYYDRFIKDFETFLPIVIPVIISKLSSREQRRFMQEIVRHPALGWGPQLLRSVHYDRHLSLLKHILEIQDNDGQTVKDLARSRNMTEIVGLIDHVCKAESFEDLDGHLRGEIAATINYRLGMPIWSKL